MKKEYNCRFCKKIIVKDILAYLEKYPNEDWMKCPYCWRHVPMASVRIDVGEKLE